MYLAFKRLGIQKGDIVTISLPSNYHALISFFGLNELGAITTFIDTYSSEDDIQSYLDKYQSPVFINYEKSPYDIKDKLNKSKLKYIITLNESLVNSRDFLMKDRLDYNSQLVDFHSLGFYAKQQKDRFHLPNNGNDSALILYTSGTTGQPKSVVLTNRNILAAQMYAGNTSHTENITATKTMTCVPLRYPYGMVTSLLTSLLWGKEAILTPDWESNTVDYYYQKEPNIIFGSPAVLELSMRFLDNKMDLSFVSHFISGGDFLTIQHADRGYEFFKLHNNSVIEIGNSCGNAETVSIGSTPVGVPLKQSTAGKILVGSTPLIIDSDIPTDRPINNGDSIEEKKYYEVGELCLAGDHVFKEYFGEPEATNCVKFKRSRKTFFRTGTLGYIDEYGYFTPTDRKSRFYIRSTGHKVYLDNVQHIVLACDERIVDCATVKVRDETELYINKAFIVLSSEWLPSESLKEELFNKFTTSIIIGEQSVQLKEYEIPKDIVFIEELPRKQGTDKIDYQALEKEALKH